MSVIAHKQIGGSSTLRRSCVWANSYDPVSEKCTIGPKKDAIAQEACSSWTGQSWSRLRKSIFKRACTNIQWVKRSKIDLSLHLLLHYTCIRAAKVRQSEHSLVAYANHEYMHQNGIWSTWHFQHESCSRRVHMNLSRGHVHFSMNG